MIIVNACIRKVLLAKRIVNNIYCTYNEIDAFWFDKVDTGEGVI